MDCTSRASEDLWQRLGATGLDPRQPTFDDLWPAIVAWAAEPIFRLGDDQEDEVNLLVAWHEPSAQGGWTYFDPPSDLSEPLFGMSFQRSVATRIGGGWSSGGNQSVGFDLFFADSPVWQRLYEEPGFLGRQDSIPALDYYCASAALGDLSDDTLIQVAAAQPLLGLSLSGAGERTWT